MVALIGSIVGLISGYFGGWVDALLMRLADIAFGIPFLPFVIVLAAFLKPSVWNVVIAMALVLWRDTARVIRSQVLTLRTRGYVDAARVAGSSDLKIILRHITPNILPLSFLYGSVAIGWAILTEAAVSFVGFGDPTRISWGFMLQDAFVSQALSRGSWHWFLPPGICIVLVVVAGFFISRGAEEVLFPKLRS
jgi:peptide/nickel transport system permease protein